MPGLISMCSRVGGLQERSEVDALLELAQSQSMHLRLPRVRFSTA